MFRGFGYRRWLVSLGLILPAALTGAPAGHVAADASTEGDYLVVYASPG